MAPHNRMAPQHFPTRRPPENRLLVFARVPKLGTVKTRLAREVGEALALAVYEAMLADVLESLGDSGEPFDLEVLWTAEGAVAGDDLRRAFGERHLAIQTGSTLGDRMAVAFSERFFFHATEKVIAVGTDDPMLSRADVLHAFDLLESCEWVLGPAEDGGYYLIGCRAGAFHSDVFRDISWSTGEVFRETTRRIREIGATVAILPQRRDVDRKGDLDELASRAAGVGGRLGEILRRNEARE